jgi:hypothetical protein
VIIQIHVLWPNKPNASGEFLNVPYSEIIELRQFRSLAASRAWRKRGARLAARGANLIAGCAAVSKVVAALFHRRFAAGGFWFGAHSDFRKISFRSAAAIAQNLSQFLRLPNTALISALCVS